MSSAVRKSMIVLIAAIMVIAEPVLFGLYGGSEKAFASVGSVAEGEEVEYGKSGGVLGRLGFDTSEMPDDYDPDATTNPYGSDVTTLKEVEELLVLQNSGSGASSTLYGHNKNLDGKYATFKADPLVKSECIDFLSEHDYVSAVKCDITGDGRDSAIAIAYTHYTYTISGISNDSKVYMRIIDPVNNVKSDEFVIGDLGANRLIFNYIIQSQIQITAGDYDKDSIDEIAVYAPSGTRDGRNRVTFFDLIDGKKCENPYSKASWRESWNYMLPLSDAQIINCSSTLNPVLGRNIYNNLDLTSGDADNDGICDLIVSYGASATKEYGLIAAVEGQEQEIVRSIPSKSVLLYGSDSGQMLRDSQEISYGGQNLIRVSFAFGDVDDDGNEDMFIAGQLQDEQSTNTTRVLGKYIYDSDAGGMALESIQDIKVVDGKWGDDNTFYTANGWDDKYHSAPLMKANLAVGEFFGAQSDTKIYLDSVLYTYDNGRYDIVDELEDDSKKQKKDNGSNDGQEEEYKGSHVFDDMKGYYSTADGQSSYYEYGADVGNFTGGLTDGVVVNRMAVWNSGDKTAGGKMNVLHTEIEKKEGNDTEILKSDEVGANSTLSMNDGSGFLATTADSDKDSLVAKYTGVHNIVYDNPKVLAVLASAPYFKDVAAYDGSMLDWCETAYGTSVGNSHGHKDTYESNLGAHLSIACGSKTIYGVSNVETGWSRAEEWGWEKSYEFEMDYSTAGGEDAVVLYSVPAECYTYEVTGVTVNDDGEGTPFTQTMVIKKDHKPVAQTLTLDDYMAIQGKYSDKLPDITKYLTSTPGEPDSYPKSENDLSEAAKEAQKRVKSDPIINEPYRVGEQYCGVGYGSGTETQSFTFSKEVRERYRNHMDGWYSVVEGGIGNENEVLTFFERGEALLHYDFNLAHGYTNASLSGSNCSCTVANMPMAAKGYGYDFSWKLFRYLIEDGGTTFPVITYIVDDVQAPPELPDNIMQDFDITTDSQIGLTWTYNHDNPQGFDIYRYEDFPQGGGDKLIATVGGSSYRVMKDDNGNTLKDKDGHVIRKYTFTDTDLTADTKYSYRLKVRRVKIPQESIFSPVIEARTDVGIRPDISLSTDSLTIYHDGTYEIKVRLADPEHYQKDISYQWQKYNTLRRKWEDVDGCDKQKIIFYNCDDSDAGDYRCRVNLIRKIESHPQYISAFTESCRVKFSLRNADFESISMYSGTGSSDVNTGISVKVINADKTSLVKPEGLVTFTLRGPNGDFSVAALIDAKTGIAKVDSIEDKIESLGQQYFVAGGYQVTARYEGNDVFYAADDPEEYHYLRNIGECRFLSVRSLYQFGEDLAETASLWDYKLEDDKVVGTDLTQDMTVIKFYQVDDHDKKTGDPVAEYTLAETDGKAPVPLDSKVIGKAYVEAYVKGETGPAAGYVIQTIKADVSFSVTEKLTGTGDLIEFLSSKDVTVTEGIDPEEKNIVTGDGKKSLEDFMLFEYYEQNGDLVCTSADQESHKSDFIPASYYVGLKLTGDDVNKFYKTTYNGARFMVVGSYFEITAEPDDKSTGYVKMVSPDKLTDFEKKGYPGGTKLVLKAVPNEGFEVAKWIVDDCGINTTTYPGTDSLTYTVSSRNTDGTGEVKIKAVMTHKNNRLMMHTVGNGQITVDPHIENDAIVLAGTKMNFTARPDPGWRFDEWHWINDGGNNIVSGGFTADDGTNTKTFIMQDNSAEVYGVFVKDSIDLLMSDDLMASYLNDGSNPHFDYGETVVTEKGRNVPKGTIVTVYLKPGVMLAPGSTWNVSVGTDEGIVPVDVEEVMVDGREGCRFRLPDNVISCMVAADTERGTFSVDTWGDDIDFAIKVDGSEIEGGTIDGIQSGSQVDIQAKPVRGKAVKNWIVNGEEVDSKDTVYSFNIIDNMNITAETEEDEAFTLTVAAEGGGKGEYVITDKNGAEIKETFGSSETTVKVYKGESVMFRTSESETGGSFTMTSLYLDGEMQSLDGGEFTLSDINKDANVVCRFFPNLYYDVTFYKKGQAVVPDVRLMDYHILENGEKVSVGKGGSLEFSVFMEDEFREFFVTRSGEKIDYYEKKHEASVYRYNFRIENITGPEEIVVSDSETIEIYNEDDLYYYFEELYKKKNENQTQPCAVLMNDIEITKTHDFSHTALYNCGVFDGQGHTISGLVIGDEDEPVPVFMGLFGSLTTSGVIKDVAFKNLTAYVSMARGGSRGCGIIVESNEGTIEGVAVLDSEIHVTVPDDPDYPSGVLSCQNTGIIRNCTVKNVSIESDATMAHTGSAGARWNDGGKMLGNYFEGLRVKGADINDYVPAERSIVVQEDAQYNTGEFTDNIFKAGYGVTDSHGTNLYDLTKHPEDQDAAEAEAATPEFIQMVAYRLNKAAGGNRWGTCGHDDAVLGLSPYGNDEMKAPVKVDFVPKDGADAVSMYCYPDDNVLPGREIFGDDTPKAWMIGGRPYTPGAHVDFDGDTVCNGVEQIDGYVASVSVMNDSGDVLGSTFYKTVNEAIEAAVLHRVIGKQELRILGNCQISGADLIIDEDTTLAISDGVVFTMRKGSQIVNKGSMIVEQGATVHKYGGVLNFGKMIIAEGSELYNYGSALDDKGIINGAGYIICKPHIFGEWEYSDEPDDEGKWSRKSTCTVCLKEVTEEVQPDPPAVRVKSIEMMKEPDKTAYETGDKFSTKGMRVVANLTDGTRTAVTKYTMTLAYDGDEEIAIKDGDPLIVEGDAKVNVKYGNFQCSFDIIVMDTANNLVIKGDDENVITDAELMPAEKITLHASLKRKLPYKTGFKWESTNSSVLMLGSETGKDVAVTAGAPGAAEIIVTVVDEHGKRIEAIQEKTVSISVLSHITAISIVGGDAAIEKGNTHQFEVKVTPEDTTDEIKWASSDTDVAEVDETGTVTGKRGGKALITVTAPNGLSDSRTVYVSEKAESLDLEPEALTVNKGGFSAISARVENAYANGEVRWTVADDSIAGFCVRNEETGEMEIVKETRTSLSSDGKESSDTYVIVAGVSGGEVTVKAATEAAGGALLEKECAVTVTDSEQAVYLTHNGARISGEHMTLSIDGQFIKLGAESTEDEDTFRWSVIDDGADPVLKVDNEGGVTLRRKGTGAVQVVSEKTGCVDVCMIKVIIEPSGVVLSEERLDLIKGQSRGIIAKLQPEDAEGRILWTSSDESVATVSENGIVKAVGSGTAVITAQPEAEGAMAAACEVRVYEAELTVQLSKKSFTYDGKKKVPAITVKNGSTVLGSGITRSNDNVIVIMQNSASKLPGTYQIVVIARDSRYGSGEAKYTINVKPTSLKKMTRKRKAFTAKWEKVSGKYIQGYQIRYSLKKNMKKAKTKTVKGAKKASLTVKKLKGGKKYYVQIRTYVKKGGSRYVSKWSKKEAVKVKK